MKITDDSNYLKDKNGELYQSLTDYSYIYNKDGKLQEIRDNVFSSGTIKYSYEFEDGLYVSDGNGGRLPPTDGLILKTAANDRVVIRPSGTEPKLKCYCEVVVPVAVDEPVEVARRTAAERLELMRSDLRGVLGV